MSKGNRVFFEQNDLLKLHKYFEEIPESWEDNERGLPDLRGCAREDIWTEALSAAESGDISAARKVHAKMKHSGISQEGKEWWDTVLSIAMDAPLEELERLSADGNVRQGQNLEGYVRVASKVLAKKAYEEERALRKKRKMIEQRRLDELKDEAAKREAKKRAAEEDLNRHRGSQ